MLMNKSSETSKTSMTNPHFLLLCCPAQGHVNPTLELAKLLLTHGGGATVTFATTVHGLRRITTTLPTLPGLSYASFSDGFDDGDHPTTDPTRAMSEFKRVGSQTLTHLLTTLSHGGSPVTFIIYTILLPWAAAVARDMHVPSAFFSSQSATTFAIFHTYFNNPSISIKLPGLPLFSSDDVPSLLLPESPHSSVTPTIIEHIQTRKEDPNPLILVNTFDAFEQDSIRAIANMKVIAIGPLIQSKNSIKIDLFERSGEDYIQWLDSKPDCSVVYVSFGSMVALEKPQIDEILKGLVQSCRPFLWVIRSQELKKNIWGAVCHHHHHHPSPTCHPPAATIHHPPPPPTTYPPPPPATHHQPPATHPPPPPPPTTTITYSPPPLTTHLPSPATHHHQPPATHPPPPLTRDHPPPTTTHHHSPSATHLPSPPTTCHRHTTSTHSLPPTTRHRHPPTRHHHSPSTIHLPPPPAIRNGLIVSWCLQLEVLGHRSIGCFVTHCGWNSTVESVVAGVAMVGCPVFSDQMTNAKMVEEVWGVGVRAVVNEEKVVEREEIERCLDVVMRGGERGEEIRKNVVK
ncbi:unnamed protein product [Camellia sinensis]